MLSPTWRKSIYTINTWWNSHRSLALRVCVGNAALCVARCGGSKAFVDQNSCQKPIRLYSGSMLKWADFVSSAVLFGWKLFGSKELSMETSKSKATVWMFIKTTTSCWINSLLLELIISIVSLLYTDDFESFYQKVSITWMPLRFCHGTPPFSYLSPGVSRIGSRRIRACWRLESTINSWEKWVCLMRIDPELTPAFPPSKKKYHSTVNMTSIMRTSQCSVLDTLIWSHSP